MLSFGMLLGAILLGLGLATDAFSVSLANGLGVPHMPLGRVCRIATVFAAFQGLMPLMGYLLVRSAARRFALLQRYIPLLALFLLLFIGAKMMLDGFFFKKEAPAGADDTYTLLLQGLATSVDALSVGFTVAEYSTAQALFCAAVIAAVTFPVCFCGVLIGRKFGTGWSGGAALIGGLILMLIGIEIFFSSL